MDYTHHHISPLGDILLASDGYALKGLWFDGQKNFAETLNCDHKESYLPIFKECEYWLEIYFSGQRPEFTPRLALKSTEFREAVWRILLTIPFGQTMTYGQIATIMAQKRGQAKMSAQAVGNAVGHNPIALIIPCHRVVGVKGSLTGYAAGIDKKLALLKMEGVKTDLMFVSKKNRTSRNHY